MQQYLLRRDCTIDLDIVNDKQYYAFIHITSYVLLHCTTMAVGCREQKRKQKAKTYNSGDSLVVTHLTTNPPVSCLYMAERTGSLIFRILWSYVTD
jgi:hypothetical protein